MRAMWALVRLQWVQIWLQPPLVAAVGVVLVWLGVPASVAVGLSLGIGAATASRTGWSIVDGSGRFLFARPVPASVFVGATGVVVVLSAAGLWLAGIAVELWAGTFQNPAHRLMRLGIMIVVFAFAHLVGATLAGLRAGARVAWLGLVSLVGMLVLFSRFVSLREASEALPVPAFVGGRWPFWGLVIVSLTTWWVATSRGVQAGRGNPERTMGAMWKALLLGAVVVLTAAGGWVAYLRAAPVERLSRLLTSRAVGDQWVMVTGLINDDTLYSPSFLLRPATQTQSRVEGWALWQPSAASADGKVFAAMVQGEGDRRARVHIADVGRDVTWRPAREIGLEYWIPFIALSPSGARLAVWTRSSLTVYDTATMKPISRIRQSHVLRALRG